MNKIAENQIANYFLDKKIEARTILSNSFNMICEKILLQNNEAFVVKYYQNKKNEFNSIISEKNSLSYLANITSLVPKIKFNSNELLIIDYIENNDIKDKNYQVILAEAISKIHQNTNNRYGFQFDAQIGALKQTNEFIDSWVVFFREKRLNSIFELINNDDPMTNNINQKIEKLLKNIHNLIPNNPIPRLLHGDLWAGNILYNNGKLVGLIDPGIFFGHNELEIAYLTWFNFVNEEFLKIYSNIIPIERDYFEYEPIYQLYYCLLNVHLWDRIYIKEVEKLLNKIKI
ncbi:MAG: fructosamine kinase family protein [Alphaproteobacteria bacterium]